MSKTLKFGIVLLIILCIAIIALTFVDGSFLEGVFNGLRALNQQMIPSSPANNFEASDPDLESAVKLALESADAKWDAYDYQIDQIQIQEDGLLAVVWLAAYEIESGELVGREPELALAKKSVEGQWQVLLEDNEKFMDVFKTFKNNEKSMEGDFISEADAQPKGTQVFGGYYLPWAAGLEKRLTWSVAHSSCTPVYYCTHAFDFADYTMFPIVAAKGGTVYFWKDTCANGDPACTNSITLEDRSTTPWTYQIYNHIAQNSIPSSLKVAGTPVMQGQYIANVDDTGYSSGHHLHFMVVSADTLYTSVNDYKWGMAEDITFRDVTINWDAATQGGRPRLAYEAQDYGGTGQTYYVSGNQPANPPTGGLTVPETSTYITWPELEVSGWGEDDIAVTKLEVLANYNGIWIKVGADQTDNPFTTTIDLCSTEIPDGFFDLGMRVWDYEGNPSGILTVRKMLKDIECGPVGTDPKVSLILDDGKLILPENGLISATATWGSTDSAIVSVEFWLHSMDWVNGMWVNLGKDTNGSNGWQAAVNTAALPDGDGYTVVALVTDALGNQDVTGIQKGIVDHSPPQVVFDLVSSPVRSSTLTLHWKASDPLSGMDSFDLAVSVDGADFITLASDLSGVTRFFQVSLEKNRQYVFALTGYDRSGNAFTTQLAFNTQESESSYENIFPLIFGGD